MPQWWQPAGVCALDILTRGYRGKRGWIEGREGALSCDTLVICLIARFSTRTLIRPATWRPPRPSFISPHYLTTHLRMTSSFLDLPPCRPLLCHLCPMPTCPSISLCIPAPPLSALSTPPLPPPAAVQQGQAGHRVLICNPLLFVSSSSSEPRPGLEERRERQGGEGRQELGRGENAQLGSCHTHAHAHKAKQSGMERKGEEKGGRLQNQPTVHRQSREGWDVGVHESFQLQQCVLFW